MIGFPPNLICEVLKNELFCLNICIFHIFALYLRHLIYDFGIHEIDPRLVRPVPTSFVSRINFCVKNLAISLRILIFAPEIILKT